mmetsp:Transcript_38807/g.91793  ORF Transcript_38807/g.91793 Transcript_38807/m.91793 type:complete len:246 (-) Transcript_38807:82-819(-)
MTSGRRKERCSLSVAPRSDAGPSPASPPRFASGVVRSRTRSVAEAGCVPGPAAPCRSSRSTPAMRISGERSCSNLTPPPGTTVTHWRVGRTATTPRRWAKSAASCCFDAPSSESCSAWGGLKTSGSGTPLTVIRARCSWPLEPFGSLMRSMRSRPTAPDVSACLTVSPGLAEGRVHSHASGEDDAGCSCKAPEITGASCPSAYPGDATVTAISESRARHTSTTETATSRTPSGAAQCPASRGSRR